MIIAINLSCKQFKLERIRRVITGWIIYNGFLESDKFRDYAEMIQKAALDYGHRALLYKNSDIISLLYSELTVYSIDRNTLPDYVVFTDKDVYLAKQLELIGIPVFNSAEAIEITDDKIKTYQKLVENHIPIPETIFAPKTFGIKTSFSTPYLQAIKHELGFPLIIKEAFGSFGEQVYLVESEKELLYKVEQIADSPFMFQQFIETSYGVDLRIQVVGDEVITAMKRTAKGDFRANATSGALMEKYEPTEVEKQTAIEATKAIGADFAGVDLLFGKDGHPLVCEVNSNAHIRNLLNCTGVNVAYYIVQYIEKKLGANRK